VGQEDMLAIWPSFYPSDAILDVLTLNGAPAAYNKNKGAGVGLSWSSGSGLSASANYVAANGALSTSSEGGFATDNAAGTGTVQVAWDGEGWTIAAIYSQIQNGHDLIAYATPFTQEHLSDDGVTHAFGLGGAWSPDREGWVPSVSLGWGINSSDVERSGGVSASQSWTLAMEWGDVFLDGNTAGMAVGQQAFVTSIDLSGDPDTAAWSSSSNAENNLARDGQYAWEFWYQFQVTDNISITPAFFYLSRPLGAATQGESFSQFGGLVKTSFRF